MQEAADAGVIDMAVDFTGVLILCEVYGDAEVDGLIIMMMMMMLSKT